MMQRDEMIYIAKQFANMFGYPFAVFEGEERIFLYSMSGFSLDLTELCHDALFSLSQNISYYIYQNTLFYGIVHMPPYRIIAGPVSALPLPEAFCRRLAFRLGIPGDLTSLFVERLNLLSGISLEALLQAMILLNYSVNRTMFSIQDIRIRQKEQKQLGGEIIEEKLTEQSSEQMQEHMKLYAIEQDIVYAISHGETEALAAGASRFSSIEISQLANNMLRHQKNFFIRLETICARAAISAGLDPEEILAVEALYIKKSETLDHIDRLKNLEYHMVLDYADRVAKFKNAQASQDKLVDEVTRYIRHHLNETIRTADIAQALGRSRGGLSAAFKERTGKKLSDYIQEIRLEAAAELLLQSSLSVAQISDYLGYSSQSHFCSVFKALYGLTPSAYRRDIQKKKDNPCVL